MLVRIANWLGSHISTALLISPYIHFFYYTTSTVKLGNKELFDKEQIGIKWRILSQTGKIGSGKNTKISFFLLGLKYLEDMF